jgi:hypothetical protein
VRFSCFSVFRREAHLFFLKHEPGDGAAAGQSIRNPQAAAGEDDELSEYRAEKPVSWSTPNLLVDMEIFPVIG